MPHTAAWGQKSGANANAKSTRQTYHYYYNYFTYMRYSNYCCTHQPRHLIIIRKTELQIFDTKVGASSSVVVQSRDIRAASAAPAFASSGSTTAAVPVLYNHALESLFFFFFSDSFFMSYFLIRLHSRAFGRCGIIRPIKLHAFQLLLNIIFYYFFSSLPKICRADSTICPFSSIIHKSTSIYTGRGNTTTHTHHDRKQQLSRPRALRGSRP